MLECILEDARTPFTVIVWSNRAILTQVRNMTGTIHKPHISVWFMSKPLNLSSVRFIYDNPSEPVICLVPS